MQLISHLGLFINSLFIFVNLRWINGDWQYSEQITTRIFGGGWRSPDGTIMAIGGLVEGGAIHLNTAFNTKTSKLNPIKAGFYCHIFIKRQSGS